MSAPRPPADLREWTLAHESAGALKYGQARLDGARISARPGYPTVIVPFGFLASDPAPAMPDGFEPKPRPFGVSSPAPPAASRGC